MGRITANIEALDEFISECESEIHQKLTELGEEGVAYAVENGEYHNVTGNLRRSNKYDVDGTKLRLYNSAPYASEVEARGLDVISGAILYTEERAKEIFGQ